MLDFNRDGTDDKKTSMAMVHLKNDFNLIRVGQKEFDLKFTLNLGVDYDLLWDFCRFYEVEFGFIWNVKG